MFYGRNVRNKIHKPKDSSLLELTSLCKSKELMKLTPPEENLNISSILAQNLAINLQRIFSPFGLSFLKKEKCH